MTFDSESTRFSTANIAGHANMNQTQPNVHLLLSWRWSVITHCLIRPNSVT